MSRKLIYEETGRPVHVRDKVTDSRGGKMEVLSIEEPRHSGSTGRVYVKLPGGGQRGYYPSVIGAVWR